MQGQNLTLKPFLYIRSCSSYSLHSMHTKKISHRLRGLTQIFVYSRTSVNICGICGRTFISCLKGILPQITRINTDFCYPRTSVNICEICGRTFISCLKGIQAQITQIYTDFCYPRTSVNICEICGKTFISCLKGNLPQITRINTDFSLPKNICEYLRDLWEISFYAAEIR